MCVLNIIVQNKGESLTLLRMGDGGAKSLPPTSFSPITSTNVGTNPQSFLSYSFDPFVTLL